ncbi:hypothetical protein GCM10027049_28750 [Mucilaginibacter puniceus]
MLVILDMQMQKKSSHLMSLALIAVSNTGKNMSNVYDVRLNINNYFIFFKYYYLKRFFIKSVVLSGGFYFRIIDSGNYYLIKSPLSNLIISIN